MNQEYWKVRGGSQRCSHVFNTRQEAEEYAAKFKKEHGIPAEIWRVTKTAKTEGKIAICDRRCRTCEYSFKDSGVASNTAYYCGYLIKTEKPRPCPAGRGCTVYKPRKKGNG